MPGLGLKRGLADSAVVAPYATALASMIDPQAAVRNFERLEAIGARGRYGRLATHRFHLIGSRTARASPSCARSWHITKG